MQGIVPTHRHSTLAQERQENTNLGSLVPEKRVLRRFFTIGPDCHFSEVPVVVAFHLQIEDLRLSRGRRWDEVLVEQAKYGRAYVAQLAFDLRPAADASSS